MSNWYIDIRRGHVCAVHKCDLNNIRRDGAIIEYMDVVTDKELVSTDLIYACPKCHTTVPDDIMEQVRHTQKLLNT